MPTLKELHVHVMGKNGKSTYSLGWDANNIQFKMFMLHHALIVHKG